MRGTGNGVPVHLLSPLGGEGLRPLFLTRPRLARVLLVPRLHKQDLVRTLTRYVNLARSLLEGGMLHEQSRLM